jgi:NAD-dependent dihydropyrimidine dehydrogenase PreA subunit
MEEDEEGKYVVVKYPEKCTACGDCLGGCKFRALSIEERV